MAGMLSKSGRREELISCLAGSETSYERKYGLRWGEPPLTTIPQNQTQASPEYSWNSKRGKNLAILEWGAIGELIGGIAIIISLIYVGIQIKHSARAAEIAAAQSYAEVDNGIEMVDFQRAGVELNRQFIVLRTPRLRCA